MLELSVEMFDAPAWMLDALCVEYPHVEFFPELGQSSKAAKAVCARCLVRDDCLRFALEEKITEGVWGGTSGKERRALRRERVTVAAAVRGSESRAERARRRQAEAVAAPRALDDLDDETLLDMMEARFGRPALPPIPRA